MFTKIAHLFTMTTETRWCISITAGLAIFALVRVLDAQKGRYADTLLNEIKGKWKKNGAMADASAILFTLFPRFWVSSAGFWLAMWLLQNGLYEGYPLQRGGIAAWFAIVICAIPAAVLLIVKAAEALPTIVVSMILAIASEVVYATHDLVGFWGVFWAAGGVAVFLYISKGFPKIFSPWLP